MPAIGESRFVVFDCELQPRLRESVALVGHSETFQTLACDGDLHALAEMYCIGFRADAYAIAAAANADQIECLRYLVANVHVRQDDVCDLSALAGPADLADAAHAATVAVAQAFCSALFRGSYGVAVALWGAGLVRGVSAFTVYDTARSAGVDGVAAVAIVSELYLHNVVAYTARDLLLAAQHRHRELFLFLVKSGVKCLRTTYELFVEHAVLAGDAEHARFLCEYIEHATYKQREIRRARGHSKPKRLSY
jgi:hypothetical protein